MVPDYIGPADNPGPGGVAGTSGTHSYTYVFAVPPDAPSPVYIHVLAADDLQAYTGTCTSGLPAVDSASLPVTGAVTCPHINLQIFNSDQDTQNYAVSVRITNFGYWPVPVNQFCVGWFFYDATYNVPGDWVVANYGNNATLYDGSNNSYVSNIGNVSTSITSIATQNCGGSREANLKATMCLGDANLTIPGAGGYLSTHNTTDTFSTWHNSTWVANNYTDRVHAHTATLAPSWAGMIDSKYATLYYGGSLISGIHRQQRQQQLDPTTPTPARSLATWRARLLLRPHPAAAISERGDRPLGAAPTSGLRAHLCVAHLLTIASAHAARRHAVAHFRPYAQPPTAHEHHRLVASRSTAADFTSTQHHRHAFAHAHAQPLSPALTPTQLCGPGFMSNIGQNDWVMSNGVCVQIVSPTSTVTPSATDTNTVSPSHPRPQPTIHLHRHPHLHALADLDARPPPTRRRRRGP